MSDRRRRFDKSDSESESEESEVLDEEKDVEEVEDNPEEDENDLEEEDIELLKNEPILYTSEDPGYQAELKRTCPPHPLFVLRWNRQQQCHRRPYPNRSNENK